MEKEATQEIREKLIEILVAQGKQGTAINGVNSSIGKIEKHLEKQNGSIDTAKTKLATHDVWIKIVSVVILAILAGMATSIF